MRLKPSSVANASAVLTIICYFVFYVLSRVSPALFAYLFNAQFLGANIASSVPALNESAITGLLLSLAVFAWVAGYLWAHLYNWFLAKR